MRSTVRGLLLISSFVFVVAVAVALIKLPTPTLPKDRDPAATAKKEESPRWVVPDLSRANLPAGISHAEVDGFWDRWKLVTTRYRSDNAELRFVFANDIAWKAMKAKAKVYPPGSLFGKVAMATDHDSSFPVSVETQSVTRIQIMKKMRSGYQSGHGWNYALFVGQNSAFNENDVKACIACHDLVPERDYVFSRPSFLARQQGQSPVPLKERFQKTELLDLDETTQNLLRQIQPNLSGVAYTLSMPLFIGSFSESFGPLGQMAAESQQVFLLLDSDNKNRFILCVPATATDQCRQRALMWGAFHDPAIDKDPQAPGTRWVDNGTYCDGKIEWNAQLPL